MKVRALTHPRYTRALVVPALFAWAVCAWPNDAAAQTTTGAGTKTNKTESAKAEKKTTETASDTKTGATSATATSTTQESLNVCGTVGYDDGKASGLQIPKRPANTEFLDDTPEHRAQAYNDLALEYVDQVREARREVLNLVSRKYQERLRDINNTYTKELTPHIANEREYRTRAIAQFENFLKAHPNEKEYTPNVMFRLAELYYEKYEDDEKQNRIAIEKAYQDWKKGGEIGPQPQQPEVRYERCVEIYRQMLAQFPDYPFADAVQYLLGYALVRKQKDDDAGFAEWTRLTEKYPKSRFYPEVLFRIGDRYFENEQWDEALAVFAKAEQVKNSNFYGRFLYKLAWTHYIVDQYDESVKTFFSLLDLIEDANNNTGANKVGELATVSQMRDEALQYIALSFAASKWTRAAQYVTKSPVQEEPDIKYVQFANDYMAKMGDKSYKRDVLDRLGRILFRQSRNREAIAALEQAILLDPLHVDDPELQYLIVQSYDREREFDKSYKSRDLLVTNYAPDSPWARHNKLSYNAVSMAANRAQQSLYETAAYYYQQGAAFFGENRQDLGTDSFRLASDSFSRYLQLYPHDKKYNETSFFLAESYYYSLQFANAAKLYEQVRDSQTTPACRSETAVNAVFAYDSLIKEQIKSNALPNKNIFATTAATLAKPETAEQIPDVYQKFISAVDALVALTPKHPQAARFLYRSAEIYYVHGQADEAQRRFQLITQQYASSDVFEPAAKMVIENYLQKQDWQSAATLADQYAMQCTTDCNKQSFIDIKGGATFNIARDTLDRGEKLYNEGKISESLALLESGAEQYLALLAENKDRQYADQMLYNAAFALERALRPAKAASLYERLYTEYPKSEFADDATYKVALKSEQSFQFDRATSVYQDLQKKYPESPYNGDAQLRTAFVLEAQQKYTKAAEAFLDFAKRFTDRKEAPAVFFRAAKNYQKANNVEAATKTLNDFIQKYGAAEGKQAIEAYVLLADLNVEEAKKRAASNQITLSKQMKSTAEQAYKNAVQIARDLKAEADPEIAYFVAKAAFVLAEPEYKAYQTMRINANRSEKQAKQLQDRDAKLIATRAVYENIISTYKQGDWAVASLVRIGDMYREMQREVLAAPCPDDIKRLSDEACDINQNQLEDAGFEIEKKAVELYKLALQKAAELQLRSESVQKAKRELNDINAEEYPADTDPMNLLPSLRNMLVVSNVDTEKRIQSAMTNNQKDQLEQVRKEAMDALVADERSIVALRTMAKVFAAEGKWETARFAIDSALKLEPNNAVLHADAGYISLQLNDNTAAETSLRKALSLQADLSPAQSALAFLLLQQGRAAEAGAALQQAVTRITDDPIVYLHLGNAARAQKDLVGAEKNYQKALSLSDKLYQAHYNLGLLYMETRLEGQDILERWKASDQSFAAAALLPEVKSNPQVSQQVRDFQETLAKRMQKEQKRREREERRLREEATQPAQPTDQPANPP